jgi:hypothetical protein
LLFIAVAAGAIWAYITGKLKQNFVLAIIGLAVLFDLWSVDKRYLNDGKFHEAEENNSSYETSAADNQILQDKTLSYRVFNYASDPFNEAITSYHHKNIGGYNPAKLARYQDIIDSCLRKNNRNVINMLNTKYFIGKAQNGQEIAQMNPEAMGNAWLVDTVRLVQSPREEIMALDKFNPRTTAIIDAVLFKDATSKQIFEKDSTAKIALLKNELDYLEYSFVAAKPQLAVLSEVFYADKKGKGWQAYIDGKAVEHFRVNYILRGLEVPAGTHKIEFKFEPQPFLRGQKISMFGSYAILLLFLVGFFMLYREYKSNEPTKPIDAVDPPKAKNKHAKS